MALMTMAAPGNGGVETGVSQNMQQGADHQAEQNKATEPQLNSQAGPESAPGVRSPVSAVDNDGFVTVPRAGDTRGVHISVMA